MKKRFKSRKHKKKKLLYLLLLPIIIYITSLINSIKITTNINIINKMLKYTNISYTFSYKKIYKNIIDNLYSIFYKPEYILKNELRYNYIKNEGYSIHDFEYSKNDIPLIYIYNSHQKEKYSNKYLEDYNIVPSVYTAAHMLKEKLDNKGINTIVEENNILEYMEQNNYDHSMSYIASRKFLAETIKKYSSIKLYIDLHRDSLSHEYTTVTLNNKNYAKVMFVIGLKNSSYELNYKVSESLNNKLNLKYSGISRGILKKGNVGANGIYNQDLNPNIILIELGGYENNIEEINNTLDILSTIIGEYINEKE